MSTSPIDPSAPWHAQSPEQACRAAAANPSTGLSEAEAAERAQRFGPNALPEPPPQPLWRLVLRQFASPLIYLLLAAAGLAVALGHQGDAAVIAVVVVLNALIGSLQEGRASRSMAALRRLASVKVRVLRAGAEQVLDASALVPGDLMLLAAGDAITADARLLEQAQLQVAEAALTGESVPVAKQVAAVPEAAGLADRHCMVYAGTQVSAGRGRALVVATGVHTEVGRIAGLTGAAQEPPTPLEQRLAQFGRALVGVALLLFVLVLALGLWRGLPVGEVLMVAISQMVSLVPEGLPVAMTIALAVGMQRMAGRGAIIRRLAAVETLGSTTVICSDKTGTLTRNEMTAVALWLPPGRELQVQGTGYAPGGQVLGPQGPVLAAQDADLRALLLAALLCNDAELRAPQDELSSWAALGDPTEAALLVLARKAGLDTTAERQAAPRLTELPFDADSKLMATGHRGADGALRVFIKGSPEAVLRLCAPGQAALCAQAAAAAEAMARRALRVLGVAVVEGQPLDEAAGVAGLAGRARLLGLVGQIDPPREDARVAVAACHAAGVRVVMVTGDHKLTGLAIAGELGIAHGHERAVDGAELERMGEAELREALPDIAVFARVQPAQKLRIVQALQARGEVVAMTGDGVNDAPALARSDVGVAMGITGTEVAKGAAKVVVTDDSFATIVAAVQQGRVVYGNLKKVILYLFATSVDEVLLLLMALLAGLPLPLLAVQILWINLVTEGTLTVNLVMDPPDGDEMRRAPTPRDDALMDRHALARAGLLAATSACVAFAWMNWRLGQGVALDMVRTEVFTLVAVTQWFNMLSCRSQRRSVFGRLLRADSRNLWLLGGLAASVLLQALVLYLPPLNQWFHTVPLPAGSVLAVVVLASAVLWVEEARKLWVRARDRRQPPQPG